MSEHEKPAAGRSEQSGEREGVKELANVERYLGPDQAGIKPEGNLKPEDIKNIQDEFLGGWQGKYGVDLRTRTWDQMDSVQIAEYFRTVPFITAPWALDPSSDPDPIDPGQIDPTEERRWKEDIYPFVVINGRRYPVTSEGPTGICGRPYFERWGEWPAADGVVIAKSHDGEYHLLVITRRDTERSVFALPGGQIDSYTTSDGRKEAEDPIVTALREVCEEALGYSGETILPSDTPLQACNKLGVSNSSVQFIAGPDLVRDPRRSDMSDATSCRVRIMLEPGGHRFNLDDGGLPILTPQEGEVRSATWVPISSLSDTKTDWYGPHRQYAIDVLRELDKVKNGIASRAIGGSV